MGRGKAKGPPKARDETWTDIGAFENAAFETFYKAMGVVPDGEWAAFMASLRAPLPSSFRINQLDPALAARLLEELRTRWVPELQKAAQVESESAAPEADAPIMVPAPVTWYPNDMAWGVDANRRALKRLSALKEFHKFVMLETSAGNFLRQEEVSMVPPMFLDLQPDSVVLDMCAAPGSKTLQLLELLGVAANRANTTPTGVVVANDMDFRRCEMLVTQTQRLHRMLPHLLLINHDGRYLPNLSVDKSRLEFDRVLCDAPCSGDGTLRKSADLWRKWTPRLGHHAHKMQIKLLDKAMMVCKTGGRIVYSTCSMNPVEDEAVVLHSLLRARGRYQLVDTTGTIPGLKSFPGLLSWPVMTAAGQLVKSMEEVPEADRKHVWATMFPVTDPSVAKALHLPRCMRFLPHTQNTGGFFVAVLEKVRDQPDPDFHPLRPHTAPTAPAGDTPAPDPVKEGTPPLPDDEEKAEGAGERQPRGSQKIKQDCLTDYLVPVPSSVADELRANLELSPAFPFDQLFQRQRSCGRRLYFVGATAATMLNAMRAADRWKIVGAGVRAFEKSGPKKEEQYRITHEALGAVLPFLPAHRVVPIARSDLLAILRIPSRSVGLKDIARTETRAALQALATQGSGCVVLRCTEGVTGGELSVSGRVATTMMYLFVGKEDLPVVLHRLGVDSGDMPTESPAVAEECSPPNGAAETGEGETPEPAEAREATEAEDDAQPSKRPRTDD